MIFNLNWKELKVQLLVKKGFCRLLWNTAAYIFCTRHAQTHYCIKKKHFKGALLFLSWSLSGRHVPLKDFLSTAVAFLALYSSFNPASFTLWKQEYFYLHWLTYWFLLIHRLIKSRCYSKPPYLHWSAIQSSLSVSKILTYYCAPPGLCPPSMLWLLGFSAFTSCGLMTPSTQIQSGKRKTRSLKGNAARSSPHTSHWPSPSKHLVRAWDSVGYVTFVHFNSEHWFSVCKDSKN